MSNVLTEIRKDLLESRKRASKLNDPHHKAKAKTLITLVGAIETVSKAENVEITDEFVYARLRNQIKQCLDAQKMINDADAPASTALGGEIAIYSAFLPQQISEDVLRAEIASLDTKNIGDIMKHLNATFPDRFDRALASKIARGQ